MSDGIQAFHPYSPADLLKLDLPELAWAVDGILPMGALTMLAGREKSGKSLLTVDLCCSVALGQPFLGRATKQGPALLVQAEDNVREVRDRIVERLAGRLDAPVWTLPVNAYEQEELYLTDKPEMARLLKTIIDYKPIVVVLDPLRELHAGEENSSDQMAPTMAPLRDIPHMTNCALVLNHHMARAGNARGSTALVGAVDQYWAYHTPADERNEDEEVEVTGGFIRVKGRYTRRLRIDAKLGKGLRWEVVERSKPTINEKNLPAKIVLALATKAEMTADELAAATGAAKQSVQEVARNMMASSSPSIAASGRGVAGDPLRYRLVLASSGEDEN